MATSVALAVGELEASTELVETTVSTDCGVAGGGGSAEATVGRRDTMRSDELDAG